MSPELLGLIEFLTGTRSAPASVPWHLLRGEDIAVIRSWARETLPLVAQRGVFKGLRSQLQHLPEVEDGAPPRRRLQGPRPRAAVAWGLAPREARLLLELCRAGQDVAAVRDAALVSMMLLAGLRRCEVARLRLGDYDEENGRILVRERGALRAVVLWGECRSDLDAWLALRGTWSGPLFLRFGRGDEAAMAGLSTSAVNRIVALRCREAGGVQATPRDLRARFLRQVRLGGARPPCRYFQDENGRAAWMLASLAGI
jgi:integrase